MHGYIPFPDISPEVFSVTIGGYAIALRWYALAYITGLLIGWRIALGLIHAPRLWPGDTAPMSAKQIEDLMTWVILGVVLGGRVGYVLFYDLAYYIANPLLILQVWHGGMSFHGGLIGAFVGMALFARRYAAPLLTVMDLSCLVAPIGIFLGRIANFIKPELWGRPTDVPWAVVFPGSDGLPRHPSQMYEAALEGLVLMVVLLALFWKTERDVLASMRNTAGPLE